MFRGKISRGPSLRLPASLLCTDLYAVCVVCVLAFATSHTRVFGGRRLSRHASAFLAAVCLRHATSRCKNRAMASVWRDLNAFVRNGGQSESVISRAHRAACQGERGCWQAEDHVMGMDEWGTMVLGVVMERVADHDGFMWVQWRSRWENDHHFPSVSGIDHHFRSVSAIEPTCSHDKSLLRIASAMPVLVVNMKDERQRQRLAQLHADAMMDLVWTKLAVHCTSHVAPQRHNLPPKCREPNDFTRA